MTVKSLKDVIQNLEDSKKVMIGKTWSLVEGNAYEVEESFEVHIVKDRVILVPIGEETKIIHTK